MQLELNVKSSSYDGLKSQLTVEADRFFEGRRYTFTDPHVEMEGNVFTATATAFEVKEQPRSRAKTEIPAEEWDPFVGAGYPDW